MEDNKILDPMNVFGQFSESYEDAVKKNAEESKSFTRAKHFRMESDGTYIVRILPIAPVKDEHDQWTLDRKGYEYPNKTMFLGIIKPESERKGKKDTKITVPIVHSSFSGISVDLIDTYVQVAQKMYSNNDKFLDTLKSSNFNGVGLKWSSQRAMYIIDMNKRNEGIQILSLSFSQYKELEERKLALWKKLLAKNPKTQCPISSFQGAYPVEIIRSTEGAKTKYAFNIDAISDRIELTEEEAKSLFDIPRLPEALYRYTKFQLEATIEYLKQYDEKMNVKVMTSQEIADAIEKIKLELPADDSSHFSFSKDNKDSEDAKKGGDLDSLWGRWEKLQDDGVGEKDEESLNLRDDIKDFIDENELEVRVTRSKTNKQLLEAIEDALENEKEEEPEETEEREEEAPEEKDAAEETEKEPEEEETETSAEEKEPEEEEESPRRSRRGEHNDDTNEPAVGADRRRSRPARRAR